jgi:GT2 family glycosyltransferase
MEYLPFTLTAIQNAEVLFEVIIVDDSSNDDSVEFVKSHYPDVTLIVNPQNKGFSYTCNRGIEAARHDLIFLLNSDVKLNPDYFDAQWKYFEHADTFGVMGRIIDMEGDHIQDAARMPGFNGFKLKTAFFYYTDNPDDRLFTLYLSGANALVDAAKVKAAGGFNELFSPFYSEDMELSLRAWRLGWKCYYEHRSVCRHRVSASTRNYKTAKWVKYIYNRNRFYVHAIHLDGIALLGWLMQVIIIDMLPKLLIGQFWLFDSYRGLLQNRKAICRSRKRLATLMSAQKSWRSLFDITRTISASITNKTTIRFKP